MVKPSQPTGSQASSPPPGSQQTLKRNSRLSRFFQKLGHPKRKENGSSGTADGVPAAAAGSTGAAGSDGKRADAVAGGPPVKEEGQPDGNATVRSKGGKDRSKPGDVQAAGGATGATGETDAETQPLTGAAAQTAPSATDQASSFSGDTDGADRSASIRPITPSSGVPASLGQNGAASQTSPRSRDSRGSELDGASFSNTNDVNSLASTDGRTFSSSLASTKPTTVVSVDPGGGGNRIAQAPVRMPSAPGELAQPNVGRGRQESLGRPLGPIAPSVTASPAHTRHGSYSTSASQQVSGTPAGGGGLDQQNGTPAGTSDHKFGLVPKHSLPHPSQNPNPGAVPPDNASVLTLASSGFAPSSRAVHNLPPDEDASVRALAPSRRESSESLSSRWSGAVLSNHISNTGGGPSVGTGPSSLRTGGGAPLGGGTSIHGGGSLLKEEVGASHETSDASDLGHDVHGGQEGHDARDDYVGDEEDKVASGLVTAPTSPRAAS